MEKAIIMKEGENKIHNYFFWKKIGLEKIVSFYINIWKKMESKIYYNNLPFTCNNISTELYKFWMDKIIKLKNKKVWLTVNATLTDNTEFTIIDKLPFNTSDYYDALIKLEDRFKSNLLSKADLLDSITFIYFIKERKLESSFLMIKKTHIISIFAFLLIILAISIYYYVIYNQPLYFVEMSTEIKSEKSNRCVFGIFSEFFKISSSSYAYYPSQFLPSNMRYDANFEKLSLLDRVMHVHYEKLYNLTQITIEHVETLRGIIEETSNSITNV